MILPTASTPSDTSFSQTGTRRTAGTLVRSFEAWLRNLSFSRSAKFDDNVASTRSKHSSAADSRPADERTRDTSSEAAPLVARRVDFKLSTVMHSINTDQCPTYFCEMVRAAAVNQMRSGLPSADATKYIKPCYRTEISKRAFSYAGPLAWKDLPPSLHCITDLKRIRKQLEIHYFNHYSSTHCNACLDNNVRQALQDWLLHRHV